MAHIKKEGDFLARTWNWYNLEDKPRDDGYGDPARKITGITEDNLIWLPIEKVPVVDYLPFNSLKQPALQVYTRIEWNYTHGAESVVKNFLAKHTEDIGYVIVHKGEKFGMIGVGFDRDHDFHAGYATIFNAHKIDVCDNIRSFGDKIKYPKLPVAITSLSKVEKSIFYKEGEYAYSHSICNYDPSGFDDLSDD